MTGRTFTKMPALSVCLLGIALPLSAQAQFQV